MSPTATTTKPVAPKNGAASAPASASSDKRKALLMQVAAGKMSLEDADKLLQELAEPRKAGNVYFKIGRKGGISAYGLQRMPVSLYIGQWERILGNRGECSSAFALAFWDFVIEHDGKDFHGKDKDGDFTSRISRKVRE